MKNRSVPFSCFLTLGAYTMVMQVTLLRECFSLFSGNELSVAIQLGLWLIFTAGGGALGSQLPPRAARVLLVILPGTGVWAISMVRLLPVLIGVPVGREIPFGWAVLSLAVAQLPLNLLAGALFPTACRLFGGNDEGRAIGRLYLVEAMGAAAAGIIYTFLWAGRVHGVQLAVWFSAAAAGAGAAVLWRMAPRARLVAAALCCVLLGGAIFVDPAGRIDDFWWRRRHPGSEHLTSIETRYQRLDIGLRQGQHTVYSNGVPSFALEDTEEFTSGYHSADIFVSLHPDPRRVLIVGSGEPGLVERVMAYPFEQVVYILPDPAALDAVKPFAGERAKVWNDPRLSVVPTDGRRFLNRSTEFFDIILLDLPSPTTAAGNRFFTVEAFRSARSRLSEDGILIFHLPHTHGEVQVVTSSIFRAVKTEFGAVNIIPGDSTIFVAGLSGSVPSVETLAKRFAARGAPMKLASGRTITEPALKEAAFCACHRVQFSDFRLAQRMAEFEAARVIPNEDAQPVAYYLNLRRWVREMGLTRRLENSIFQTAEGAVAFLKMYWILCTLAVASVAGVLALLLSERKEPGGSAWRRTMLAVAVLGSGWAGMTGELAIVYMYQSTFGQIYREIGALFATYMVGLVAGSAVTSSRCKTQRSRVAWLLGTRLGMIVSCGAAVILPLVGSAAALFAALFIYALALGMEYPVANRIYKQDEKGDRAAGALHTMDHLGAALATLVGGTVILPLVGSRSILFAAAGVHLVILTGLVMSFKWPWRIA